MDEEDELMFNYYFLLLQTEYRHKYEEALKNCWTLIIPIGTSIKNMPITEYFVDQHILKPTHSPIYFISNRRREPYMYKIEKNLITSMGEPHECSNAEILKRAKKRPNPSTEETEEDMMRYNIQPESNKNLIRILSVEKGYNNQYQPYNIIIVDKPLDEVCRENKRDETLLTLVVDGFDNAAEFLEILSIKNTFDMLQAESLVLYLQSCQYENDDEMKNKIKFYIQSNWADTLRRNHKEHQRDERFQKRLSLALEIYILHGLHQIIYDKISENFKEKNAHLKEKIDALNAVGATPDQLGVREGFAIMLAHGVVELARLCATIGPHARLNCLKSSLDMAIAEIKGAVAESVSKNDNDDESTLNMTIMPGDLIQICTYLIVKCKCYTLYQDLYYIDNYVFSLNPADKTGYILTIYKSALENLEKIDTNNLPTRSEKVKAEIGIDDLLTFVMKDEPPALSPIDLHIKNVTSMIKKSTLTIDGNDSSSEED